MTLTSVSSETKTQTTTTRALYASASDTGSPASPRIFASSDHHHHHHRHHRPLAALRNSPSPLDQLDVSFAVQRARSDADDQAILEDAAALGGLFTESLAGFSACPRCEGVRAKGLNEWMDHLGECHPVPSRWPSSKVDRLVAGQDLHHPYTTVVDSHKKRRRNVIPRPLNSFMIFAQYVRRLTLYAFPDAPNVHISRRMGVLWRTLAPIDREAFSDEARRLQNLHALEFPDYKYRPRKRNRAGAREPHTEALGSPSPPPALPPPPSPVAPDPINGVENPLYPITSLLPGKLANLNDMASRLDASSPLMVQVPDHQQTKPEPPGSLDVDTSSSTSLSHCCSDGRSINWAGSVHQAALEEEGEGDDWTLDPRTLCCPPEAWNHLFEHSVAASTSPSGNECNPEAHLSYKAFSALSTPPYKCQLSPVDCSRTALCHHLKPEDSQVSPSRSPLTAPKSPSVEWAVPPCYRDTTTWSFPTRSALSPRTDPSCTEQLYAANLAAQRQHDGGDNTAGAEDMRSLVPGELLEPDFDSLAPEGIIDFINYIKFNHLASCLEDTTAQPIGSKAGVEAATADSQESREPVSSSPSSPPTRQNALPSIESWVRNANFSP